MTDAPKQFRAYLLAAAFVIASQAMRVAAQRNPDAPGTGPRQVTTRRDGQHDFDFEIGTWKTHFTRLAHPLSGSTEWLAYDGTTTVRKRFPR